MSPYQVNKLFRNINRSTDLAERSRADPDALLKHYDLTPEEHDALKNLEGSGAP